MLEKIQNKTRRIFQAGIAVFAVDFVLSLVQVVDAAPKLPKSLGRDSIQGWCIENGGVFSDFGDGSGYYCFLPDGSLVVCDTTGGGTSCVTWPAAKVHSLKAGLSTLAVGSIKIQETQDQILTRLNSITTQLTTVISGQNALANQVNGLELACTTPDLLPLPAPGTTGPEGFCRRDDQGILTILIYNQGGADAPASTTSVTFKGPGSLLDAVFNLPTPALTAFGGFAELTIEIPNSCYDPATNKCNFAISADVNNGIAEADEPNNSALGVCGPSFL